VTRSQWPGNGPRTARAAPPPHPGGPGLGRTSTAAATWALFAGVGLVSLGNGLTGAVVGLRAQAEGFGPTVSGLVMACYFAGFLFGTRYVEYALARVGHIRVFAALASTASSVVLVQVLWISPWSWALLRMLFGLCLAGLYVNVESWLNDLATNQTRGRILAVYMVVSMGAIGAGQGLVNLGEVGGFALFAGASVLVSMALVPVTLSATSSPPAGVPTPLRFRELAGVAPTGMLTSFLVGNAVGILIGLGAVYGAAKGMTDGEVSLFISAPMAGAVILQFPIGRLSDRVSRRGVMLVVAIVGSIAAMVMAVVDLPSGVSVALMVVLGGSIYPLYSLAIAYTNDWLDQSQMLGASALLVRINGTGAVVGPFVVAPLLILGLSLFFWSMAIALGIIALVLGQRIVARDPVPVEDQSTFEVFPGRGSRMAVRLLARKR